MQQLNNYLENLKIKALNPMQEEVIQQFDRDKDLILLSPTGSGKTLAFALIAFRLLKEHPVTLGSTLIIVPTRELALQIEGVFKKLDNQIKMICLYGGNDTQVEKKKLRDNPQIIVSTPGRLIYHIERLPNLLDETHTLVLDEFDKSLELGFQEQISFIVEKCIKLQHQILTSATDIPEIPEYVQLKEPLRLNFLSKETLLPDLTYHKVEVATKFKLEALFKLICKIADERVLVFCNHREAAEHISELLESKGIMSIPYHGGLDQYFRELAIIKFRNGSQNILITTDLASRGLDIPEMNHVVHYQFPFKEDDFIHRNGRAGRNQQKGNVYGIKTVDERCPEYYKEVPLLELNEFYPLPMEPTYHTIRITAGKKQKVNKIDIVGYIMSLGDFKKDDLGLIEVKATDSYVAIKREIARTVIKLGNNGKIKGQKVRINLI